MFSEWGWFLASGDHKTRKTLIRGPKNLVLGLENSFYCHFPASRGRKWHFGINYKKIFSVPGNKVFRILWPPKAKNDPQSENIKRPDFKKKKKIFCAKRSFLASEGHKWQMKLFSSPNKGFSGSRNKVFRVLWPQEAKNDPHSVNTKKNFWK